MKNLTFVLLAMLIAEYAEGQAITPQTINATGGSHRKGNLRLDWNVGEMALVNLLTASEGGYLVTNGLIQPYTENPTSLNNFILFDSEEIRILPNPTHGLLEVNVKTKQQGQVTIRLYDELGLLLITKRVDVYGYGQIVRLDMTAYLKGTYMMKVELRPTTGFVPKKGSYKIIKVD